MSHALQTLMFFMVTACGSHEVSQVLAVTPIDLQPLVAEFTLARGRPTITPVEFANELEFQREGAEENTIGLCVYNEIGINRVIILRSFWEAAEDTARWVVVFHELGHCELGREHRDIMESDGCPVSLMRWEISSTTRCIESGERTTDDYERELFKS